MINIDLIKPLRPMDGWTWGEQLQLHWLSPLFKKCDHGGPTPSVQHLTADRQSQQTTWECSEKKSQKFLSGAGGYQNKRPVSILFPSVNWPVTKCQVNANVVLLVKMMKWKVNSVLQLYVFELNESVIHCVNKKFLRRSLINLINPELCITLWVTCLFLAFVSIAQSLLPLSEHDSSQK